MSKVADQLRAFVQAYSSPTYNETHKMTFGEYEAKLLDLADKIDREHERRMEQCRHETKRAFARYLRQVTAEYERDHKRKPWLAQQRMQLELDVLKYGGGQGMTGKEYYEILRNEQGKANKLANEIIVTARERNVSIPMLIKSLCEDYAASEADISSRGAYDGGYEHGVSDGRDAERRGW